MRSWSAPATAFIVLVVTAAAALAETRPIRGETIKTLISGGTIELDTPLGSKLPLKFDPDGTVSGSSVVLAFYLGSTSDRGRWRISNNKLCTKFARWFDGKDRCLTIRPADGSKFAWTMDDGDTGTASIVSNTKKLYGSASALTGGVSAVAMVRNAEERMAAAAAKAKAAKIAALSAPAPAKPKAAPPALVQPALATEPDPAILMSAVATVEDHPQAWLPMSVVRNAANIKPVNVAYMAAATEAPAATPTYRIAGVATSDALNIRRGPQVNAEVIGSIPAQASGVALNGSCEGDWCPVTFQSQAGWVSLQFLQAE